MQRRKGVDAVVAGTDRVVFRRSVRVTHREDIGVNRILVRSHLQRLTENGEVRRVVNSANDRVRIVADRDPPEAGIGLEFAKDCGDPHG